MRISDWSSDVCSSDLRFVGRKEKVSDSENPRNADPGAGDAQRIHWMLSRRGAIDAEEACGLRHQKNGNDQEQGCRGPAHRYGAVQVSKPGRHRYDHAVGDPHQPGEDLLRQPTAFRSEEHTSELQSLMRISYADFCLKKK